MLTFPDFFQHQIKAWLKTLFLREKQE